MKLFVCKISVMILALALCLFFASCGGVADGSKDSKGVDFNSTDSSFTSESKESSSNTDNEENNDTESSKNTVESNESTNSSENTVQSNESSVNSNESSNSSDTGSSVPDIEKPDFFVATVQRASEFIAQPYIGSANVPEELDGIYYSSSAPGGEPVIDGSGCIYLSLKPIKTYRVSEINAKGEYSSIDNLGDDVYCISGVNSDLSINVTVKQLPVAGWDLLESYGHAISQSGKMLVSWNEIPDTLIRYVELSYTLNGTTNIEYIDARYGKAELFTMTEGVVYTVTMRPIGYSYIGKAVEVQGCYMNEPRNVAFPRVEITTKDYILPSCDFVQSPEGCWGAGITNALYENCIMTIYNSDNEIVYVTSDREDYDEAKIKIRGNTSARHEKNGRYPYKIKLDNPADLLKPFIDGRDDGQGYEDSDWLLLNYGSNGFRIIGDAIADAVETEWSPDYCYVSLYLNGEYRGLYVLSEAVEEGNSEGENQWRVPADDDGYVFECDAYWWNEDLYFSTPMTEKTPMYFTFKYPDPDSMTVESPEYLYLKEYMTRFEEALQKNDDSYLDYIDLDSFVKWLLVTDYLCITDGGGCNIFLYKKDSTSETKVAMGPNWDFDSYMGDYNGVATIRVYWSTCPFYIPYLVKKPSFQARYKELFNETCGKLENYINNAFSKVDIDAHLELLKYDNMRFGTSQKSLAVRRDNFLSWLELRIEWMKTQN